MKLKNVIDKLFVLTTWNIGYRILEDGANELPYGNNVLYRTIPSNDWKYYADPFVFKYNDKIYLFAEYMNSFRGKASISVAEYKNGKFGRFKEVLKEDFHLSYPNVFEHKNALYIIPESSEVGERRLYKAVWFPYKWKFEKVLSESKKLYVDSSFFVLGRKAFGNYKLS